MIKEAMATIVALGFERFYVNLVKFAQRHGHDISEPIFDILRDIDETTMCLMPENNTTK